MTRKLSSESASCRPWGTVHSRADVAPPIHADLSWRANRPGSFAFLIPRAPKPGLMLFRQTWIGLGKSRGGNVGRGGASPTYDPISQSCVADVQGPE